MKLTNGQIFTAGQALRQLIGQKIPVLTSAKIVRLVQELDIHLSVINGVRNNLIKQYGTEEDGQTIVKPNTPEMVSFAKDWADLLQEEVEIKFDGNKIKLPWTIEISPVTLIALQMFVELPEDKDVQK